MATGTVGYEPAWQLSAGPLRREYHKWFSPALGRDMELLVFGHAGARVLVFPTRAGRFFDYENFGILDGAGDRIRAGHLQLFCLDSVDAESFYCNWRRPADRMHRHTRYEEYVLQEVVPLTETLNPNPSLMAHGCSLGAFHALTLAFRHPRRFVKVVALSGRYDLTLPVEHFRDLLDGHFDETVYYYMPSQFIPNLTDLVTLGDLRRMQIVLVVGGEDPFLPNNAHLSAHLSAKGISHDLHVWDGRAHRPERWREMVRAYL